MAHQQTNSVLVYVRMYAVTERGVVGLQENCKLVGGELKLLALLHGISSC